MVEPQSIINPFIEVYDLQQYGDQSIRIASHIYRFGCIKYFLNAFLSSPFWGYSQSIRTPIGLLLLSANYGGIPALTFLIIFSFRLFSDLSDLLRPGNSLLWDFSVCLLTVFAVNIMLLNDYGALPVSVYLLFVFSSSAAPPHPPTAPKTYDPV